MQPDDLRGHRPLRPSGRRPWRTWLFWGLAVALVGFPVPSRGEDDVVSHVTFTDEMGEARNVDGKILLEAADGGIAVLGRDGRLWLVPPDRLSKREDTDQAFAPLNDEELGAQLAAEFGGDFEIVTTRHYVICCQAGQKYAQWCGALFERLMNGFMTHWRSRAMKLHEPESPLVAIVFANEQEFAEFATRDVGPAAVDSKGYYSVRSNRIILYDLTAGVDSRPARSTADITRKVSASPFNVATVVHEATHQIAFNCGLHTRYADNPVWLTEGMAMYFETPDLRSRNGWRTIGQINSRRMQRFKESVADRKSPDSLKALIANDERFRDREQAGEAYAEAWALTYYLIKTHRDEYIEYLKRIAAKPRLNWDKPEQRLEDFRAAFGDDLESLDRDFLRYMLRRR